MEKQLPVMEHILNLSETMGEGLQHIARLFHEGKFENGLPLFEDVIQAFTTIEQSFASLSSNMEALGIVQEEQEKFRTALDYIVTQMESGAHEQSKEVLHFTVLPRWRKWKGALEAAFRSFLVS
ncbi:hypothetical protein SAMN05192534_102141 [Alteribacillus persepolensis]|uniref:DUF8042 domain-containing protein n=1 Tax=Alteribacillus persepolensis TaxID=568899 RepID=A0A1G8AFR1_9BACI|nr:hypothetical protein [Alteribacillus persepolensis]SDH19792.1 hypothetical protein SAMN05192534_102141 [Alteribacillus persepolensis]